MNLTLAQAKALGIDLEAIRVPEPDGRKPSKYRNQRVEYDGILFDSKAEAARARELDLMMRADPCLWYLRQVPFTLGSPDERWRLDFAVFRGVELLRAEDIKGFKTRDLPRQIRLWKRFGRVPLWIVQKDRIEIVTGTRTGELERP